MAELFTQEAPGGTSQKRKKERLGFDDCKRGKK